MRKMTIPNWLDAWKLPSRAVQAMAFRRRLGLKEGESDLLLDIDETPLAVTTRAQAVKRIQNWAAHFVEPGRRISEEFIEQRRKRAEEDLGA